MSWNCEGRSLVSLEAQHHASVEDDSDESGRVRPAAGADAVRRGAVRAEVPGWPQPAAEAPAAPSRHHGELPSGFHRRGGEHG